MEFVKFEKSNNKNKKYKAILKDDKGSFKSVHFGDTRYQQYKDTTGLGEYTHLDHNDDKRRRLYKSRHEKTRHNKHSASWFSDNYLW